MLVIVSYSTVQNYLYINQLKVNDNELILIFTNLSFNRPNSILKVSLQGENCSNSYKSYHNYISK